MLRNRKARKRFSLLLLDEGEEYEGDYVGFLTPPDECKEVTSAAQSSSARSRQHSKDGQGTTIKGRIRLCSVSVVFDPDEIRAPIIKFPLKDVQQLEPETNPDGFVLATTSFICMKENGLDSPYVFQRGKDSKRWRFELAYAGLEALLKPLHEALHCAKLSWMEQRMFLAQATRGKLERLPQFDVAHLRDALGEHVLLNTPAIYHAPLVKEPGRLVVTNYALYFEPLNDIDGDTPVRIHPLGYALCVAKRKYRLRQRALEVFFVEPSTSSTPRWDDSSALFTFQTKEACGKTYETLVNHSDLGAKTPQGGQGAKLACLLLGGGDKYVAMVTDLWQRAALSNLDYLLYLNVISGRSFNDLGQWPVFPWILKDYTSDTLDLTRAESFRDLSKPIGALNPDRLAMLKERFAIMPDDDPENPPFLYGTHYSNPGYVMYWLVRAAPGHLLRLQSGRFDSPDRMFYSIQESWQSVLTNPADVKELIPEFFTASAIKFLRSNDSLPLGCRQNGTPIDAVDLPPWAASPEDFASKHKAALECEHVSSRLHTWIDLIFGHKSRGDPAIAADNVFHHLTYGNVDLDAIQDDTHRAAIEAQVQEFGQTPAQVFTAPHPPRDANSGEGGEGEGGRTETEGVGIKDVSATSCLSTIVGAIMETREEASDLNWLINDTQLMLYSFSPM